VISTVEKKFAKTPAFDWLRYFVIQNTSIWSASLFPFRNGVETNSTTRRREIFRRETLQNHVAQAFNLFARNFSHFARRGIMPWTAESASQSITVSAISACVTRDEISRDLETIKRKQTNETPYCACEFTTSLNQIKVAGINR
jgi:hypothetical protein